jgi:hypothetical protein
MSVYVLLHKETETRIGVDQRDGDRGTSRKSEIIRFTYRQLTVYPELFIPYITEYSPTASNQIGKAFIGTVLLLYGISKAIITGPRKYM